MMAKLAIRLFGAYFRNRRSAYVSVHDKLVKADMHLSVEEWLSRISLYALIITLLFFPVFILLSRYGFSYFRGWDGLGDFLGWDGLGYFLVWDIIKQPLSITLGDLLPLTAEFLLLVLVLAIPFLISFILFYPYPSIRIWERRRKIDAQLPHAIGWMSSLAAVGVVPYGIIKRLSETEEFYGELSKEAKRLVRDVEILGFDFMTALKNLSAITPSERLRTFLQGAITSALSGGEMGSYFISKAKENLEENRRRFADFITTLGILSELYITGLVAGPLFVVVMFSAMVLLSGASPVALMVVIYGIIPVGSLLFIILTDAMTPEGVR